MGEDELTFEQAYRELEEIVQKLEQGGLMLEESLQLYERGVTLANICNAHLEQAELRVKRLIPQPDGEIDTEPFEGWEA
ncbi:MAG: exodeoxyribonuclease VII small subunit [Anaerolineae bacterium]